MAVPCRAERGRDGACQRARRPQPVRLAADHDDRRIRPLGGHRAGRGLHRVRQAVGVERVDSLPLAGSALGRVEDGLAASGRRRLRHDAGAVDPGPHDARRRAEHGDFRSGRRVATSSAASAPFDMPTMPIRSPATPGCAFSPASARVKVATGIAFSVANWVGRPTYDRCSTTWPRVASSAAWPAAPLLKPPSDPPSSRIAGTLPGCAGPVQVADVSGVLDPLWRRRVGSDDGSGLGKGGGQGEGGREHRSTSLKTSVLCAAAD